MKTSLESEFPKRPLSLLEKDESVKPGRFPGKQERVGEINLPRNPDTLKKNEYDAILAETRESILGNELLLKKLILAIIEKTEGNAVKKFADIENTFVEKCIDLQENDIDALIRQFNRKFLEYLSVNKGTYDISGKNLEKAVTGQFNIEPKGINSVVKFLRERMRLLTTIPTNRFILGFNSRLDATRKIDVIEVIFGENSTEIDQLNLIQVKSSNPTIEEMDQIVGEHKNFANHEIISSQDIEDMKISGEEEEKIMRETISNQAIMFERIFELCAEYEGGNNELLLRDLGLEELNNMQRAWVLNSHMREIQNQVDHAFFEGYIEEDKRDGLIKDLESP